MGGMGSVGQLQPYSTSNTEKNLPDIQLPATYCLPERIHHVSEERWRMMKLDFSIALAETVITRGGIFKIS
jgi:hypothetical protein